MLCAASSITSFNSTSHVQCHTAGATSGTVAKAIEKGGTLWHLKEVGVLLL